MKLIQDNLYLVSPKYEFPVQIGLNNQIIVRTDDGWKWEDASAVLLPISFDEHDDNDFSEFSLGGIQINAIELEQRMLQQAGYDLQKYYPKQENCPFYCTKCGIGV